MCELDCVEPGGTLSFEGTVVLSPDAPSYHAITFWLTLELEAPAEVTASARYG